MTHLHDPSQTKIVAFQKREDQDAENFKKYMLEILDEARARVEAGEVQSFAFSMELKDFGVYTDFTGGFNPVLIGATSHLLWRLNEVE